MPEREPYIFERLDKDDAVLLIIDLQGGLYGLARDFDSTIYHNAMIAHAALGKLFSLPPVLDMYPDTKVVARNGEVNAWDNEEFREAIKATGKSQIIMAGIVTDVCTTFLALSLRAEGYGVWANVEASGTTSTLIRDISNDRMARAGVQVVSMFAIICDLMRDWRNDPGAETVLPWLAQHYPAYGHIAATHGYAVNSGQIIPGQKNLIP